MPGEHAEQVSPLGPCSTLGSFGLSRRTATVAGGAAAVHAVTNVVAVVTVVVAEVISTRGGWRWSLVVGGPGRAGKHGAELLGRVELYWFGVNVTILGEGYRA